MDKMALAKLMLLMFKKNDDSRERKPKKRISEY